MYRKHLGPTLSAAVEAATGIDPDEQVAVFHELALLREYAGQFVAMYSAAVENDVVVKANPDSTSEQRARAQANLSAAGSMMSEALNMVTDVCTKAAKIREKQKDRFSVHDLKYVIEKIQVIHHRLIGKEHPELARSFADALNGELTLPSGAGDKGTELHPDDTAREYDSSIPYVEDDDDAEEEF